MSSLTKATIYTTIIVLISYACGPNEADTPSQSVESIERITSQRTAESGLKVHVLLMGEGVPFDIEPISVTGGFYGCDDSWELQESFLGSVYAGSGCRAPLIYRTVSFKVHGQIITLTPHNIGLLDAMSELWRFEQNTKGAVLTGGKTQNFDNHQLTVIGLNDTSIETGLYGEACDSYRPFEISRNPLEGTIDLDFNAPNGGYRGDQVVSWDISDSAGIFVTSMNNGIRIVLTDSGDWSLYNIRVDIGDSSCVIEEIDVSFSRREVF